MIIVTVGNDDSMATCYGPWALNQYHFMAFRVSLWGGGQWSVFRLLASFPVGVLGFSLMFHRPFRLAAAAGIIMVTYIQIQ